jgi:hypothetical protein
VIALLDKAEKDHNGDSEAVHAAFDRIIYEFLMDRDFKDVAIRYRTPRHTFHYA